MLLTISILMCDGYIIIYRFGGFAGRGAAASAILNVPVIGNLLRSLGCVEAHRHILDMYLQNGETIGM